MRQLVKELPKERQTMLFSATQTTKGGCGGAAGEEASEWGSGDGTCSGERRVSQGTHPHPLGEGEGMAGCECIHTPAQVGGPVLALARTS